MINNSKWLFFGSFFAGLSVVLGAFGAHELEAMLSDDDMSTYETAVRYQMYHSLGLILLYSISSRLPENKVKIIGWSFILGITLFSGSLYLLVASNVSFLGAITPLGGTSFLIGWFYLTKEAYISNKN
ncbi:MAG: DUF423 domain-containing protein [Candidatus Kariarchaeaceae archaeon]|jgi:uncharacterized membrane protein YgdD (TMEM256/DUF423 family)